MLQARDVTYTVNGSTLAAGVDVDVRPGPRGGADRPQRRRQVDAAAHPCRRAQAHARQRAARRARPRILLGRRAGAAARRRAAGERARLSLHGARGGHAGRQRAGLRRGARRRPATAALDALDAVGLRELADRLYVHLSGGERQRVHIARALSQLAAAAVPSGRDPVLPARRAHLQPRSGPPVAGAGRHPAPGPRGARRALPSSTTSTWPRPWPTSWSCWRAAGSWPQARPARS